MAISTCTVSGTIKDVTNTAVTSATINVYLTTPFFHTDGTYIANYQVSTTTDTDGDFAIALIETESVSRSLVLEIIYPGGSTGNLKNVYNIVVPDTGIATLASLITVTE
jgi:hypothetical protein